MDSAARYIYAETGTNVDEARAIGQIFVNRSRANQRQFGGQDLGRVMSRASIADDNGGSKLYKAANPKNIPYLSARGGACAQYKMAQDAARFVLRTNPQLDVPGGGILPSGDYYYFLGGSPKTAGHRVGSTVFYNRYPGK